MVAISSEVAILAKTFDVKFDSVSIALETTAQHEEGNLEIAQNVKLAEPKEIRATMNKADVCRELYNAAEFHLSSPQRKRR